MSGKISFHFDDGFMSHYESVFPVFKKANVPASIVYNICGENKISFENLREMQSQGWEIISHSVNHVKMGAPLDNATAYTEIVESKELLIKEGLNVKQFVTPMSQCHESMRELLQKNYDGAFTRYTNSKDMPVEKLIINRPVNPYELNRCCLSGKTVDELKEYVDYVCENDSWMVFYEHDIGVGENISIANLEELLYYCIEKGVNVITSCDALDQEKCRVKILQDGYDGKKCYVHARLAVHDNDMLITSQLMDVAGSDCFEVLQSKFSSDGGKSWTSFISNESFALRYRDGYRIACSDMTPVYHKHTERFIALGHMAVYNKDSIVPVPRGTLFNCATPYAIYDTDAKHFGEIKYIDMPDKEKYYNFGSGCSQVLELDKGELLIPISFLEKHGNELDKNSKGAVMRCSFDGETIKVIEVGKDIDIPSEKRGIGEMSVVFFENRYYLTIRGDTYGYVSVSKDGINYTEPQTWKWDNGEILPTYNTQSHWLCCNGKLYLVYTRKDSTNGHVFRHRAPLWVSKVDTEKLAVIRESEFVAVPERGARLGNFGVTWQNEDKAYILVTEWMQPAGCEKYGSNNALWFADVTV